MVRGRIIYYVAAVLLIISGCVSAPPKATLVPAATALTPTPVAIISTPIPTIPTPSQTMPIFTPTVKVISYPGSVDGEANFTVQWEISGGTSGDISHTSVHWGYSSVKISNYISNYTRESKAQTGKTPHIFSAELKAPAGGDYIYFRVHAIVDGAELYSNEYQIAINPRYTGGGGGY